MNIKTTERMVISMKALFLEIVNMSFTATIIINLILILRFIMFKKSPKIYIYVLWSVVLFRLICPISFESKLSIFNLNDKSTINNDLINTYIAANGDILSHEQEVQTEIFNTPNNITEFEHEPSKFENTEGEKSYFTKDNIISICSILWLIGALCMFINAFVSFIKLKYKLKKAIHIDKNIYESNSVETAIILGLTHPKIYLPKNCMTEENLKYIILHEQTHIKRLDHITTIVSFTALCIHWFNPFVWLAFNLSNKDMEMACDEKVIEILKCKSEYSTLLLNFSSQNKNIKSNIINPLSFSKSDIKERIVNILNYRKPSTIITFFLLISLLIITYAFGTNSLTSDKNNISNSKTDVKNIASDVNQNSNDNLNISANDNNLNKGIVPINCLVIGVDKSGSRMDSIIAASILKDKVEFLSIPSSTRQIKENFHTGFSLDNANDIMNKASEIAGINIDKFIVLNIESSLKLLETIGDINFEIPDGGMIYDDEHQNLHINIDSGINTLSPEEIIDVYRFRNYIDGDLGRIATQQRLLKSIFSQSQSTLNNIDTTTLTKLIFSDFFTELETNLIIDDIKNIYDIYREIEVDNILFDTLVGEYNIDSNHILYYDPI